MPTIANEPQPRDLRVDLLSRAGQAWSTAEDVVAEMRAVQAALLTGDPRGAVQCFDRGRRLAERLVKTLTTEPRTP
jgi:hypothetical protein